MQWIAQSEKDNATNTLEKRLWEAADQLRANSGLTAAQYSNPVLGLIFLRFAEARFAKRRGELEKAGSTGRRGSSRIDEPNAYHAEGVVYLTPNARYDHLLNLPEGANVGKEINDAITDIEKHNPHLAGVLPHTYQIFNSTLLKQLLKKVSEIPETLEYDAFGRIYEYFLGEFARTEGQKGGEFFTPSSIVRLIVEIIEPFHGRLLDLASGSGGMFVQSARFVQAHKKNPSSELAIHGQEKVGATVALSRMNLAVHGLEGDIREANSYYEDEHDSTGNFDFVLANPPFNVNAVDKDRLKDSVGKGRRYPFGLPRTDNGNYLWIQLFYSSLNKKAAPVLSWPTPPPTPAPPSRNCENSLSKRTPWTRWSPLGRTCFIRSRFRARCGSWTRRKLSFRFVHPHPGLLPAGEGATGSSFRDWWSKLGSCEKSKRRRKKSCGNFCATGSSPISNFGANTR